MTTASGVRAGGAFVEIFAKDGQFQQAMARVQGKMKAVGQTMQRFGTMFSLAGTAMGAPMILAARQAATFEDAILGMRAAAGLGEKDIARVTKEALRLSKAMGIDPAQIAQAFLELTKAGMSVDEVLAGAGRSAVEFARVSGVEMKRAAEFMKVSMNVFGVSATDAVDTLSAAADASETSIEAMVESFSQVGSAGKTFDQTLFGVSQAMAALAKYGISGEEAGTAIKTLLTKLVAPTGEAHEALATLGLSVRDFRDEAGKLLPIAQIAGVFERSLAKMGGNAEDLMMAQAALVDVFEQRGIKVIGAFADLGEKGFADIAKAMEGNLPVAAKFEIMMSGITGGFQKLYAGVQRLSIAFTTALGPSISKVVDAMVLAMDAVSAFIRQFPMVAKVAAGAALGLFGLGAVLIGLGIACRVAAVGLGLIVSPIGLITAAVGALLIAAYKLSPAFKQAADSIMAAIQKLDFASAVKQWNLTIAIGLTQFVRFFHVAFSRVKDMAAGMFSFVEDKVAESVNAIYEMTGNPFRNEVKGEERRRQEAEDRAKKTEELNKQYEDTANELRSELAKEKARANRREAERDPAANNAKRDPFRNPLGGDPAGKPGENERVSLGTFASSIMGQLGIGPKLDPREQAAKAQDEAAKAQRAAAVEMRDLNGNMKRFIDVLKERSGDKEPSGKVIDMTQGDENVVPPPVERAVDLPWWADKEAFDGLNGGPAKPELSLEQGLDELKRFNESKIRGDGGAMNVAPEEAKPTKVKPPAEPTEAKADEKPQPEIPLLGRLNPPKQGPDKPYPLMMDDMRREVAASARGDLWNRLQLPVNPGFKATLRGMQASLGDAAKQPEPSAKQTDQTSKDMISAAEKTAAATQKAADLLAKLVDEARRGGLAFA